MSWKQGFMRLASGIDDYLDAIRTHVKRRYHLFGPLYICTYLTYGNNEKLSVRGRVLENKNLRVATQKDSFWTNISNMYKRFMSDEVPGAKLRAVYGNDTYEAVTDKEGYFEIIIPAPNIHQDHIWHQVNLELVEAPVPFTGKVNAVAEVMAPNILSSYGIISDIDDTIIESFVTDRLKMLKAVLLKNARTRSPFEGVSAFYKLLQKGKSGTSDNPFFYVSSSPWNLYDFLIDFFEIHEIPKGPLLLKDLGFDPDKFISKGHRSHKLEEIVKILESYPDLPFILIGDSGQKDPVIYREIAEKYPEQILAVYIRDVNLPDRAKIVLDISASMVSGKTPMVLIENSAKAVEHAMNYGLIPLQN